MPPVPPFSGAGLSTRWRLAAFGGAVLTGLAAGLAPTFAILAMGLPVLLTLVVGFSETVLVLFLTAGVYKQDPLLMRIMPLDTTVCLALFLALGLLIAMFRRRVHVPAAAWLLAPIYLTVFLGLMAGPGAYGAEKGTRFLTLTLLGTLSGFVLLGERRSMNRFLTSLAVLAVFLSLYAAQSSQTTYEGRLTLQGSNPIYFGRIAALSLTFAWLRLHFTKRPFEVAISLVILAISCYTVLAAGSRGPLLSVVLSMLLISMVTASAHGRSPMSMRLVVIVVVSGVLAVVLETIPSLPLHRFQLLLNENMGASVFSRGILFATAWKLTLTHPLGLGVGGFAKHAILDLQYPHNLFLEVGCELGWLPLLALFVLIGWCFMTLRKILQTEYTWTTLFLAVLVMTGVMNSMVSGDLNSNRLLFGVLLLPFIYRRAQLAEARGSVERSSAEPRPEHQPAQD